VNYYERHLGDYARDAGHLSMLEHGAYSLLLDRYYSTERPISRGDAYRICRARSRDEKAAVDAVLREFFVVSGEEFVNNRAEEEISKARARIEAARTNGAKGGRPKANQDQTQKKPSGFPAGTPDLTQTKALHTPDTRHQETPPTPSRGKVHDFPPGFERLWSVYPRKVGKDAAAKAFAKRKPNAAMVETMVKAIEAQRSCRDWTKDGGQFIPHLSTWLNEGRWMDEIGSFSQANDIFAGAM